MHSPGINGEGELRGQPANPGSHGKMVVKMECVCSESLIQSNSINNRCNSHHRNSWFIIYIYG